MFKTLSNLNNVEFSKSVVVNYIFFPFTIFPFVILYFKFTSHLTVLIWIVLEGVAVGASIHLNNSKLFWLSIAGRLTLILHLIVIGLIVIGFVVNWLL